MKLVILILGIFLSSVTFAVSPIEGLPRAVAQKHLAITKEECQADLNQAPQTYNLSFGYKLYLVPCMMGAYQGSSRAYIQDRYQTVSQIMVLAYDDYFHSIIGSLDLGTPTFNAQTQTLSTFSKARGLGDCGQSSQSKILVDEYSFSVKTIEIRSKSKCDLKDDVWPIIFKQE